MIDKQLNDAKEYEKLDINLYKKRINLTEGGKLEIFHNKDKSKKIETKNGKIFKSEITFLVIPGGSYKFLGKREQTSISKKFFSLGYSSSLLLYSVYPSCYPTNYNQGLQALKILSSKYKKIIIVGFSAGAHLAGLLGTTDRKKIFKAAGMILCYPVISFVRKTHLYSMKNFFGKKNRINAENKKLFSIENRVNSQTLPTFIWTLRYDKVVPYQNTLYMIQKLEENNVKFESKIFNEGSHGVALADNYTLLLGIKIYKYKKVSKWVNLACNFVKKILDNS